jgi:hypothetical protein
MKQVTYNQLGKNGRIGNCMFQIAATIGYALDHGYDYVFPEWQYEYIYAHKLPTYSELMAKIEYQNLITINESGFEYNELPLLPIEKINLHGYFQSKKYWEKHTYTVHHFFKLNPDLEKSLQLSRITSFKGRSTCSIHVRRGDYLLPHATAYHGVLPLSYYLHAVNKLYGDNTDDVLFVICSDDIEWCKANFTFKNMIFGNSTNEYGDMYLMAACRDNIIANSSYSWWSAELNTFPYKIVIAPEKWFNQAPLNTKDLYNPEWIRL